MEKPINTATFVTEVTVIDPDSKGEVELSVMKHEGGGMIALDSSWLDQCFPDDIDPIIDDPFNAGQLLKLKGL
jgi:hypothetical protein